MPAIDAATFERLRLFANAAHDEALACAKVGAFRAGCVMIGAALEAMLLVTACACEAELRDAGLWLERKEFLRWDLGELLAIAADAGWLPKSGASPEESDFPQRAQLGDHAPYVKLLRNYVHPGAFVREAPAEFELEEAHFVRAYGFLAAAFNATAEVMADAAT